MRVKGLSSNSFVAPVLIVTILLLFTGCASKPKMPEQYYYEQAKSLVTMLRCNEQNMLTYQELKAGQFVVDYAVKRFDSDTSRAIKERYDEYERMSKIKIPSYVCDESRALISSKLREIIEYEQRKNVSPKQIDALLSNSGIDPNNASSGYNYTSAPSVNIQPIEPLQGISSGSLIVPSNYDRNYVPNPQPGILVTSTIEGGARVCKYTGQKIISIRVNQMCPQILK